MSRTARYLNLLALENGSSSLRIGLGAAYAIDTTSQITLLCLGGYLDNGRLGPWVEVFVKDSWAEYLLGSRSFVYLEDYHPYNLPYSAAKDNNGMW